MFALPKWLKDQAKAQRAIRLNQPRVTSEEARRQCERVALGATEYGCLPESGEIIRLSREDSIRFAEALINPPKANARLVRAAKRHAELVTMRFAGVARLAPGETTDDVRMAYYRKKYSI